MRVLVTGGAGFIGSHVVDALLQRGDEPVILDDFSTGDEANVQPNVEVIRADIANPNVVQEIITVCPEAVVHAAAQASVPRSMADPVRDRHANLVGTQHVIDAARALGGSRVVLLSTGGGIYGETQTPATEDTPPRPKSFYSLHKYAAEKYLELSGLPYAIARLANIYGPRQQSHLEGGVVAIFAERLAKGQPVTIYGSGEQRRDLVHVRDTAEAILAMMDTAQNDTWNVGTGMATTINELLERMETIIRPATKINREPSRIGDVFSSCLAVNKIGQELGWKPTHSLSEGLETLIQKRRTASA